MFGAVVNVVDDALVIVVLKNRASGDSAAIGTFSPPSPTMAASRIQGIFVPNMVPLDKEGEVNQPELRRYINWLIAKCMDSIPTARPASSFASPPKSGGA